MRLFYSKYIFHARKHRTIISHLLTIAFFSGLLILIVIPYTCCLFESRYSPHACFTSAMAQGKGRQISEAVPLPFGNTRHISIAAHDERYCYITVQKNSFFKILSGASSIKTHFYNDRGNQITVPQKDRCYYFQKIRQTSVSSGSRIFIKFTNMSTKAAEITVRYQRESEDIKNKIKHTTPKPKITSSPKKKPTTHVKSDSSKRTHSPAPASRKRTEKTLSVTPHFIQLTPGTKRRLSISVNHVPVSLADCHYLLTEPSLLSVHNSTITAKKEGTAILYFRTGQADVCGSCLIRILKLD